MNYALGGNQFKSVSVISLPVLQPTPPSPVIASSAQWGLCRSTAGTPLTLSHQWHRRWLVCHICPKEVFAAIPQRLDLNMTSCSTNPGSGFALASKIPWTSPVTRLSRHCLGMGEGVATCPFCLGHVGGSYFILNQLSSFILFICLIM